MQKLIGRRAGLLVTIALLLVAPTAAQAALPVGEAEGVRIVRERGAIVVVFTKPAQRLYQRIAGKRVSVLCTELQSDGYNTGGATQRAPKRGRRIRTGDLTRGMDYCRVWLAARTVRRTRHGRTLIVSIPLTQKGAVYLDEQSKSLELLGLLTVAGIYGKDKPPTFPTPAELLAAIEKDAPGSKPKLVALASPTDTPPAGSVGYYSDGQQHVAAVILSASGRRLFFETEADDVLHTNVAQYIFGDLH